MEHLGVFLVFLKKLKIFLLIDVRSLMSIFTLQLMNIENVILKHVYVQTCVRL